MDPQFWDGSGSVLLLTERDGGLFPMVFSIGNIEVCIGVKNSDAEDLVVEVLKRTLALFGGEDHNEWFFPYLQGRPTLVLPSFFPPRGSWGWNAFEKEGLEQGGISPSQVLLSSLTPTIEWEINIIEEEAPIMV